MTLATSRLGVAGGQRLAAFVCHAAVAKDRVRKSESDGARDMGLVVRWNGRCRLNRSFGNASQPSGG
jgi:hypothetical protein